MAITMLTYDAGREREWLGQTLGRWQQEGWLDSERAARFHRRLKRLARVLRMPWEAVLADIRQDAELIELD